MNPLSVDRNDVIRRLLAVMDRDHPGSKRHAERVAVYAVATAERLGYSLEDLIEVRIAAELHELSPEDLTAVSFNVDDKARSIIKLCDQFDSRQTGCLDGNSAGHEASLNWLKSDAESEFDSKIVEALFIAQVVIQPTGT